MRQRVFVGGLFEEATRQTGVALAANRADGAESLVITVCARRIALVDLMLGTWSLLSYRNAIWRWDTEGGGATKLPRSYLLIRPASAGTLASDLTKEIQKHTEDSAELRIVTLDDPNIVNRNIKNYPELDFMENPLSVAEGKAFRSLFTKGERLRLARGEITKTVPRADWPPEVFAYIKKKEEWEVSMYKKMVADMAKEGRPILFGPPDHSVPESVSFERDADWFPPIVCFHVEGQSGGAIIGSTTENKYWDDQFQSRWLMPGETMSDPVTEARLMPTPKEPPPPIDPYFNPPPPGMPPAVNALPQRRNEDYRLLREFNKLTGVPVFARFINDSTLFARYNKPLSEFVAAIRAGTTRTTKWRDHMLLITAMQRVLKPTSLDVLVPWGPVRMFRDAVFNHPDAAPTLSDYCTLAHDLTPEQLTALDTCGTLTPDSASVHTGLEVVVKLRPLFLELFRRTDTRRAIETERGVRLRDLGVAARAAVVLAGATAFGPSANVFTAVKDTPDAKSLAGLRCRIRTVYGSEGLDERTRARETVGPTQLPPRRSWLEIFDAEDKPVLPEQSQTIILYWPVRDPDVMRATWYTTNTVEPSG